mmetsp:Transcript_120139/g.347119  ORF Transcript_120139/g.347119 Transcript_120139/m.347119 type:complete len:200 (-) Transcript_120139:1280-1879(-)
MREGIRDVVALPDHKVHVRALRFAPHLLHAGNELENVHHPIHVTVEQREHLMRVIQVDRQRLHVLPYIWLGKTSHELIARNCPVARRVHIVQQLEQVPHERRSLVRLLLNQQAPVAFPKLDGAIYEDAGHDVQHREQVDKDVKPHEDAIEPTSRCNQVRYLAPIPATGHAFEQRVHRAEHRPKSLLHALARLWVQAFAP